jgi:hypothetical protein
MQARWAWPIALLAAILFAPDACRAAAPIRVMILDGESAGPYHDWRIVTGLLRRQLEAAGLFQVEVVTAPPAEADYRQFKPDFSRYQAIVFNYDAPDERWPAELKQSFETYMAAGGGLVIVHASDNAFPGWRAFNEMTGVGGWRQRDEKAGPYWYFRDGKLVADSTPGVAGSHGRRLPYVITVREKHPITDGLPDMWTHQADELYAHLRGPGMNMTVLATAFSDPANAGSGRDEPQLMVLRYGKGRIFHTTLGHDGVALNSADFVMTFQRGAEWAATGAVTQRVPDAFSGQQLRSTSTD